MSGTTLRTTLVQTFPLAVVVVRFVVVSSPDVLLLRRVLAWLFSASGCV
ncbi:hypothetical protein A2U01_0088215, partial [Trifolium medium]|nr:hypothetical protein [Trifolium medium]